MCLSDLLEQYENELFNKYNHENDYENTEED